MLTKNIKGDRVMILRIIFAVSVGVVFGSICGLIFKMLNKRVKKPVPDESRIDILRRYSDYESQQEIQKHSMKMVLNRPAPEILDKYNYRSYCAVDLENKDALVFSMLDFVCDNFSHTGDAVLQSDHSITGVIKSCEKNGLKTNCRGLSIILAEALRMNGIKARIVTCKPYEEPFVDCHVVVDCLMPSGTRIMLDPTYRLYLTNDNGKYISLAKLREGIIAGRTFHHNVKASYNGVDFNYHDYIEYMTKNVFRFNTNYNQDDTDSVFSEIELVPKGYTTKGYSKVIQFTTDRDYFWGMG